MRTKKTLLIAALLLAALPALAQKRSAEQTLTPKPSGAIGGFLYVSGTNAFSYRAIGTTGQFLTVASGLPAWTTFALTMIPNGTEGDWFIAGASSPAFGKIAGKEVSGWLQPSTLNQYIVRGRLLVGAQYGATLTTDARMLSVFAGAETTTVSTVDVVGFFAPNLLNGQQAKTYFGTSSAQYQGWVWTYQAGNHSGGQGHFLWLRSTDTTLGRTMLFQSKDTAVDSNEVDAINFQMRGSDIGNAACYAPFAEIYIGCKKLVFQSQTGNIWAIRNVTGYFWPTAHAAGPLCNDGVGSLGWNTCGGTGTVTGGSGGTTGLTLTGSVTLTLGGTLAVANGGTGGTTRTAGFNNLAPASSVKGDLLVHNGTDWVRLAVGGTNGWGLVVDSSTATGVKWAAGGTGLTSINADTTAAQVISAGSGITVVTSAGTTTITAAAGAGFAGQTYMFSDAAITPATGYERLGYGSTPSLYTLKPNFDFGVTKANAVTSVPEGWLWVNSGKVQAADENTTQANGIFLQHANGSVSDWWSGTYTAPMLCKELDPTTGVDWLIRYRVPTASQAANKWTIPILIYNAATPGEFVRFDMNNLTLRSSWGVASSGATVALSSGAVNTGVWVRLQGQLGIWNWRYSTTNSATPPTDWLGLDYRASVGPGGATWRACFGLLNPSTLNPGPVAHLMYFNDRQTGQLINFDTVAHAAANLGFGGSGYDDAGTVQQLVTDFDLGASTAVTTDADLRQSLAAITNLRLGDSAVATASGVRCAATSCACSSYTAIASASWSGSGRYASICEKLTSTGRILPGSLDAKNFKMKWVP